MIKIALTAAAFVTLLGCSPSPSVKYETIQNPDEAGKIKFHMRSSLIKIGAKRDDKTSEVRLVSISIPTDEPTSQVYSILPQNSVGLKTQLKVTYLDNTRLISSLGSEIKDTRAKLIGEIGNVVVTAIPFLSLPLSDPARQTVPGALPIVIDVEEYLDNSGKNADSYDKEVTGSWTPLPNNDSWDYRLLVHPPSKDAMETVDFFHKFASTSTSVFPYSACANATLQLRRDAKIEQTFSVTVARPLSVETIRLPDKGKIDMHTSCGVNVTNESTDTSSTWALLSELLKQAKAIKDAQDAQDAK